MKQMKCHVLALLSFFLVLQSTIYAEFHHVEGCTVCHDYTKFNDPTANLRGIHDVIRTPNSGYKEVVFRDNEDNDTDGDIADFADGDSLYNGVCEVCHTQNNHHNNDGHDNTEHFDGKKCTKCHLHVNEFAPPIPQAHRRHLEDDTGPKIADCTGCHQDPYADPSIFHDGNNLANTTVCDVCHGPTGPYPGTLGLMDPVLGAKANFREGVYKSDGWLKEGKEYWCATCHDEYLVSASIPNPPPPPPDPLPAIVEVPYTTATFNGVWTDILNEPSSGPPYVEYKMSYWGDADATYEFNIVESGYYNVFMLWQWQTDNGNPDNVGTAYSGPGYATVSGPFGLDQSIAAAGSYVDLGSWYFEAGPARWFIEKPNRPSDTKDRMVGGDLRLIYNPGGGGGGPSFAYAPNVVGDNDKFGFFVTGHGVSKVHCTECHDPRKMHVDHLYRTFDINESNGDTVNMAWGDAYRLQTKDSTPGAALCIRCHDLRGFRAYDVEGGYTEQTNMRSMASNNYTNNHQRHVFNEDGNYRSSDSDYDGVQDSTIKCTNCHNVHGSYRPQMFRDGRLAGDYGSTNNMPAFMLEYNSFAKAKWTPTLQGGDYNVSVRWPVVANATTKAQYTVKSAELTTSTFVMDQTVNGDTWMPLGTYTFNEGSGGFVFVNNQVADNTYVIADAVRFTSAAEEVIMDNGDANYTTFGTLGSGAAGYLGDYDSITVGDTAYDENATRPETFGFRVPDGSIPRLIGSNYLCNAWCHSGAGPTRTGTRANLAGVGRTFTGPKVINRFETKRWIPSDGSVDAEIWVTPRDYDGNLASVKIDLSSIGLSATQDMTHVYGQTYKYVIPGSKIKEQYDLGVLTDKSHSFVVTATGDEGYTANYTTYIFPTESNDTIYMDTNEFESYVTGNWYLHPHYDNTAPKFGQEYRRTFASLATSYGIWRPEIPQTGRYDVYAFWNETGTDVTYTVYAADGTFTEHRNQAEAGTGGKWRPLGTYSFTKGNSGYIKQTSRYGGAMVADAMKFVRVNSAPLVRLSAKQHNRKTRIITVSSDFVTVTATASDYDTGDTPDTFTYDWSGSDAAVLQQNWSQTGYNGEKFDFNPIGLAPGLYNIEVNVTDVGGASTVVRLDLQVPQNYPVLDAVDTDGDGVNDDVEGLWDEDEDGIPNYLDKNVSRNAIPDAGTLSIMTENGLDIRVGSTALKAGSADGVISYAEWQAHGDGAGGLTDGTGSSIIGGIFDFDIVGLKTIGQSVKVAFPLQWGATVEAGSHYNKTDNTGTWYQFVEDADNAVESALKVGGVCPDPGSSSYRTLTAGDECIQLTIKDGGPNDADGLANGEVKDPGGLVAGPPEASAAAPAGDSSADTPSVSYSGSSGGGAMGFWTLLMLSLFGLRLLSRRSS